MTAAVPMTMPIMVSAERILLAHSVSSAEAKNSQIFTRKASTLSAARRWAPAGVRRRRGLRGLHGSAFLELLDVAAGDDVLFGEPPRDDDLGIAGESLADLDLVRLFVFHHVDVMLAGVIEHRRKRHDQRVRRLPGDDVDVARHAGAQE